MNLFVVFGLFVGTMCLQASDDFSQFSQPVWSNYRGFRALRAPQPSENNRNYRSADGGILYKMFSYNRKRRAVQNDDTDNYFSDTELLKRRTLETIDPHQYNNPNIVYRRTAVRCLEPKDLSLAPSPKSGGH